ncbi:hypothetical protein [Shewanella algae]|uniref:hypothetical protein n=1 Tax=Shewanella algae TaxID=38313 RepID=UPI0031F4F427
MAAHNVRVTEIKFLGVSKEVWFYFVGALFSMMMAVIFPSILLKLVLIIFGGFFLFYALLHLKYNGKSYEMKFHFIKHKDNNWYTSWVGKYRE